MLETDESILGGCQVSSGRGWVVGVDGVVPVEGQPLPATEEHEGAPRHHHHGQHGEPRHLGTPQELHPRPQGVEGGGRGQGEQEGHEGHLQDAGDATEDPNEKISCYAGRDKYDNYIWYIHCERILEFNLPKLVNSPSNF